jgi:hypothetical protein
MVPQYTGYSVYADLKVGANNQDETTPEFAAGNAAGDTSYGHIKWDQDLSDGVDSGLVKVQLVAGPSGVTWTVGNKAPVQVADSVGGDVLSLKVRAGVSGPGRQSSWSNLVASFYTSADADLSQPQEQLTISSSRSPAASTFGSTDPDAVSDQATDITPEGSGYAKVVLTAYVRIESLAQYIMPPPDAMFGDVYLYTSPPPVAAPAETSAVYVASAQPQTATTDTSVVEISNFTDTLSSDELALLA